MEAFMRSKYLQQEAEFFATGPTLATTSDEPSSDRSLKIEWLTTEEAANFLRISVKALRNMASNGQVPFYKLGRRNRYRKDELEALLLSQKRGKYGNQV
jgi:excisionase family DNA binding protein